MHLLSYVASHITSSGGIYERFVGKYEDKALVSVTEDLVGPHQL
jgi:hypothetical protein